MKLSEMEQSRGGKVLMHTSLNRADLFTWQEEVFAEYRSAGALVDTWQLDDHPDGQGGTFTLYACTIVIPSGDARRNALQEAAAEVERVANIWEGDSAYRLGALTALAALRQRAKQAADA